MAQVDRITFKATTQLIYPDNNTGEISPADIRAQMDDIADSTPFKTTTKTKRNDFSMLHDLIENGYVRGEKRKGYWGVKYNRSIENMFNIILNLLRVKFKSDFLINKNYQPYSGDKC